MGKASRAKRRRAAVRSAKRSKNNNGWYALIALIVIVGVALVVYSKNSALSDTGPYVANQNNANDPHNKDSHWHAALGVYDCDHWVGDLGPGLWSWPAQSVQQSRGRASNPAVYAGMHSHEDGIIHMEPSVQEEAGRHATIGKYFEYGGWKLSSTSYDFVGTKVKNGDKCGDKPGTLQWATARFNGDTKGRQNYVVRKGDPSAYKLLNDDVVVLAFLPEGKTIDSIGNPPSLVKLPDAASRESHDTVTPSTPVPAPTASTAPAGTTPNTSATATTKP